MHIAQIRTKQESLVAKTTQFEQTLAAKVRRGLWLCYCVQILSVSDLSLRD